MEKPKPIYKVDIKRGSIPRVPNECYMTPRLREGEKKSVSIGFYELKEIKRG